MLSMYLPVSEVLSEMALEGRRGMVGDRDGVANAETKIDAATMWPPEMWRILPQRDKRKT